MKLFPQDLGDKRSRILLLRRAGLPFRSIADGHDDQTDRAALGFWGRAWLTTSKNKTGRLTTAKSKKAADTTDSAVVDEAALCALRGLRHRTRAWATLGALPALAAVGIFTGGVTGGIHPPEMVALVLGSSGLAYFCAIGRPRALLAARLRKIREQPLMAEEIAFLLPMATDQLERSYLTLMMEVSRQEVSGSALPGDMAGTRTDLREALQALGDSIDRLPVGRTAGSERPDIMTEVLRRTAEETLKQAQAEPDRVVAASLIRQVEALHRRADATNRADTLVRRFWALRQEIAAETEALRAGLAAYYTGSGDVTDLTRLVQNVRAVAREAAAATAAVEEVDAVMDAAVTPTTTPRMPTGWTPDRYTPAEGETQPASVRIRPGT